MTPPITYVFVWHHYVSDYAVRMVYMALEAARHLARDDGLRLEPMQ